MVQSAVYPHSPKVRNFVTRTAAAVVLLAAVLFSNGAMAADEAPASAPAVQTEQAAPAQQPAAQAAQVQAPDKAQAAQAAAANPDAGDQVDNHPWWFWPGCLLVFCFVLGIIAVMAGVGGGVLFVPLVSGFFPFHLDFVRGAGLMVALAGALAAGPGLLRRNLASLRPVPSSAPSLVSPCPRPSSRPALAARFSASPACFFSPRTPSVPL